MSIYVPSTHIMSELRCHGNLLTSSKTAKPIFRFLWVIFFIIRHNLSLPHEVHSEWRISLRVFTGDLLLPCGIAFILLYLIISKPSIFACSSFSRVSHLPCYSKCKELLILHNHINSALTLISN